MYSTYKLNKLGNSIQPRCIPFLIWNQSVIACPVLTVTYLPANRFLRRQVRWSGIPISWRIFHSCDLHSQGFGIVNKVDVFLELSCFFDYPVDIGDLISGSSAFSKFSLNIWKFMVHTVEVRLSEFWALLCQHVRWGQLCASLNILWHCPSLGLESKLTFSSPMATADFSKLAGILSVAL